MTSHIPSSLDGTVAVVTGAAKRLGAGIARHLHSQGSNIIIHCFRSESDARLLESELNANRSHSAAVVVTELGRRSQAERLIEASLSVWGRLDIVVNNASSFYPTPVGEITDNQFDDLFFSNVSAPLFITQAASAPLSKSNGCVINMIDIHANRPLAEHSVYCAAKNAAAMLTRSLAVELSPKVRVNGVSPGVILWPESNADNASELQSEIIAKIPLRVQGEIDDIAHTVGFLVSESARYITGQIISVDGGKSLC
ncbi:MAG: pteridine reductase [Gammaproteobacteria bacterium]|nr:pteridine reductase [Gammaproteobacteria bacterium]